MMKLSQPFSTDQTEPGSFHMILRPTPALPPSSAEGLGMLEVTHTIARPHSSL